LGRKLLVIGLFLLLISFVNAQSIFRESDDIGMNILIPDRAKVIKQHGFEQNFDYMIEQIDETQWQITVCHKNFLDNKDKKLKSGKDLNDYPVSWKKAKNKTKEKKKKTLKLKNKMCDSFIVPFEKMDILKFGEETTEIIFDGDNVTIVVHPETKVCDYLYCESDVIVTNHNNYNISINLSDLSTTIGSFSTHYPYVRNITVCNNFNCTDNETMLVTTIEKTYSDVEIIITPNSSHVFTIEATLPEKESSYKYNVSIFYFNQTYTIDPFFTTTDVSFNGTYINTTLNGSGFVQLSGTNNTGSYISEVFDATANVSWHNIFWNNSGYGTHYPDNEGIENEPNGVDMTGNVLLLHLDEASGGVIDSSGHNSDGVNVNVTTQITGIYNYSYDFNTNDYLNFSHNSVFNFEKDTDFTILLWYRTSNDGAGVRRWVSKQSGSNGFGFGHASGIPTLYVGAGVYFNFAGQFPYDNTYRLTGVIVNRSSSANSWFVVDTSFYGIGGVNSNLYNATTNVDLILGGQGGFGDILGDMDELSIWNRTLSQAEVIDFYIRGKTKMELYAKTCDDTICSGESWQRQAEPSPQNLSLPINQYFQYRFDFSTTDLIYTPKLYGVTIGYNITCTNESWQINVSACQLNDSKLTTYTDMVGICGTEGLPPDNGTYSSCNYCSEDILAVDSSCYLLNSSFVKNRTYTDNNYFSCCAITGLPSDCNILTSPYNETQIIPCNVTLYDDFELDVDLEVFFGFGIGGLASDKVNGKIWINDTNTTYYCLSYVETINREVVQINPPYTQRVPGGLFQLIPKEIENREFFITQNGLANVYWTNNNLVIDGRQYIFGVECSANNQLLKSEQLAQTFYEPINAPITRFVWVKDNAVAVVLIIIFGILAVLILSWIFYKLLRSR